MKPITLLCISLSTALVVGTVSLITNLNKEIENQKIQGKCISSYINLGIERKDILLVGSTDCQVKK